MRLFGLLLAGGLCASPFAAFPQDEEERLELEEAAPHVYEGMTIYGLQTTFDVEAALPGMTPFVGVRILGTEGRWALVEYPSQTRGPAWVNFDQVISYRTDR